MSDTPDATFPALVGHAWAIFANLDQSALPPWQAKMVKQWLLLYEDALRPDRMEYAACQEGQP